MASAAMVGSAETRSRSGSLAGSRNNSFSDDVSTRRPTGGASTDFFPSSSPAERSGRTFGHSTDHSRSVAYGQLEGERGYGSGESSVHGSASHASQSHHSRSYDDLSVVDARSRSDAAPIEPIVVTNREQAFDLMAEGRYRPPLPIFAPQPMTALMRVCWSHDPEERPGFMEIVGQLEDMITTHPRTDFPCEVGNFASFADK